MHQFPAQHLCTNFFTCSQRWCQVHNIAQVPSKAEESKTSPQHTGQVILLEKADVMWLESIVGKNANTLIQICKKSSQGQEKNW
jgi:hypothetical protein